MKRMLGPIFMGKDMSYTFFLNALQLLFSFTLIVADFLIE